MEIPMSEQYKVLRLPAVLDRVGLGRASIYAYMARGDFPRPIRVGKSAVAWRERDIIEWLSSREAA